MKIRMFISIPIKDTSSLQPMLNDVSKVKNVRATPISQMHITLRFIGDIDDGKTKKVAKCISDSVSGMGPFIVSVKGSGCFPNRKRPSVVWIGVEPEDVLKGIADRISDNLRSMNIKFDEKPFKGHITVGRCNGSAEVDGLLERYSNTEFTSFVCDEIFIMRSELSPKGAKHTVLERVPLLG